MKIDINKNVVSIKNLLQRISEVFDEEIALNKQIENNTILNFKKDDKEKYYLVGNVDLRCVEMIVDDLNVEKVKYIRGSEHIMTRIIERYRNFSKFNKINIYCFNSNNEFDEDCNYSVLRASINDEYILFDFVKSYLESTSNKLYDKKTILAYIRHYLKNKELYYLVSNDEVVSMARIAMKTNKYALIKDVYTKSEHRTLGYATFLLKSVCQRILLEKLNPVLYTFKDNIEANGLYKKVGFKKVNSIIEIGSKI